MLLLVFALLAAAFGFLALLGWVLELPRLTSFGADLMPMAPSTAVLFLLFGAATGLRGRTPLSRRSFWVSVAAGWFGALAALLLFVLSCLNIHWAVEHLGLNVTGTVGGAPKGHISPVGAFCFLLASVSFLASLSRSAIPRWRVALASGSAGVLLATCFIFLLAYLYGAPLLYGGSFIPPALNTILAFTMLGVALLLSAVRSSGPRGGQPKEIAITSYVFLLVFVLLVAGIVAVGYLYYRHYEKQYRTEVEHQLSAIADLKVNELARWRKERLGDGNLLFKNAFFSALVRRFLEKPEDADVRQQLQTWAEKFKTHYQSEQVSLLDAQGITRLSAPAGLNPSCPETQRLASVALRLGQIIMEDFNRHGRGDPVYLAVLVPILDGSDANRPLGVFVLHINPAAFLYPFIRRWPTPSQTAETLLVRREGNEAVFLNELRFQTNTALNLRAPLDRVTLPAAQAALGREGIFEGIDYRGVPVVSALRTIPDSPWSLVARMDTTEVYAPMRAQLWQVVALIGALLFGAGACVGLVWRHQRSRFYREQYQMSEAMRASELRYRRLFESAKDGILILDAETGMVVDVNPFLIKMLGYSHEMFLGKKVWELEFFKDIIANQDNFAELQQKEYIRYEDMALETSDGRRIEVEFVSNVYLVNRQKVIQCNVRDITDRKRAEAAAQRSAQELQEKNAELERFLYTASHDLKSPVVTVRTFLGYLEQDTAAADAGRVEKDLRFIRAATDKMGQLLDELLEISRIGRVVSPPVSIALRKLVDEALGAVAGRIAERGVTVKVGDTDMLLRGDRPRLAEIWQNLAENACKFMGDQKEPRIEIGVETRGAETVFFVRDNGIGIDPRYHAKVFGLFEKLDPRAEGTGLGLALAKRIVELYQGRIWVESLGQGQGACFYFTLPAAEVRRQETGDRRQDSGGRS